MLLAVTLMLCSFEEKVQSLPIFMHEDAGKPREELLEDMFRLLNHVHPGDKAKMPTGGNHRSLSCGDVLIITPPNAPTEWWLCASLGWQEITPDQLHKHLNMTSLERSFCKVLGKRGG